ncbi:glycosyltransferase [Rhodococcus triatomae]
MEHLISQPHGPDAIVTVVPVHNERELLPRCLDSITRAAELAPVPVTTIVVLDSCTDGSEEVVGDGARLVRVDHRNVGAARAAGFAASGLDDIGNVWFATTDADTTVPRTWFTDQLAYWADHDAVVGTVRVAWSAHSARTRRRHDAAYARRRGTTHGHVHGANLGLRADVYREVGGFRPLALAEDVDLVDRLRAAGARIAWDEENAVTTSDRRTPRARGGFGDHLAAIERAAGRDGHPSVLEDAS